MNPLHPITTFILNDGRYMPAVGLGTFLSESKDVGKAIKIAIKNGYRHIDTAATYFTESEIGEAIQKLIKEGIVTREEIFITTKLWCDRKEEIEEACKESFKKLQLDYID